MVQPRLQRQAHLWLAYHCMANGGRVTQQVDLQGKALTGVVT